MVKLVKCGFFLGEYRHNLTDKNRLAMPKRIRIEIEGYEVILSKGFESCITGFDKSKWEKMAADQLAVQFNEDRGRKLRRQIFSTAMITELDNQGRLVLPGTLLNWANLKGKVGEEVIIIGAGDHFEIWEETNWRKINQ